MSALTSAKRARAIKRVLRQLAKEPGNVIHLAEFRQLVPERICPQCGMKFDRYRVNQIYCSERCRNLAGVKRHRERHASER